MLSKILFGVILTPVIYLAIACGLVLSQWPATLAPNTSQTGGLDFSNVLSGDRATPQESEHLKMRDGHMLPVRIYGAPQQGPLLVLVHGSGWHGLQFDSLARALGEQAYVVVPDLRGHGAAPQSRGDIDHIGQYEEDLADMIDQLRQDQQEVVIAGHSSGGGLVVRMAGGAYRDRMDKAILLAPFLKYNAPTMRPNSGGWARGLTRRLIGQSMLNSVGITALNHLVAMQFAMPQVVLEGPLGHTATTSYSYRLNASYAPRDAYLEDVAGLPPFLLIAGRNDEAFIAEAYEPLLSGATEAGAYHLIEGVGHLDVVDVPETKALIRKFLQK